MSANKIDYTREQPNMTGEGGAGKDSQTINSLNPQSASYLFPHKAPQTAFLKFNCSAFRAQGESRGVGPELCFCFYHPQQEKHPWIILLHQSRA